MAILVVDDDADLLDILTFAIRRRGHSVIPSHDGVTALQRIASEKPELVLLEPAIAQSGGIELLTKIRAITSVPILVLSRINTEVEIVRAFELGADDYVVKPFGPSELLARVEALLRRGAGSGGVPIGPGVLKAGEIELETQAHTVKRNGVEIRLTPIEFKLLHELVLHEGQVMPYRLLVNRIWGYDSEDESNLLKGHVRNLRRKIGDDSANPIFVHTVTGVGYTFRRQIAAGSGAGGDSRS